MQSCIGGFFVPRGAFALGVSSVIDKQINKLHIYLVHERTAALREIMARHGWSIDTVANLLNKKSSTVRQWRSRSGSVISAFDLDRLYQIQRGALSGEPWVHTSNGLPLPTMENLEVVLIDTIWMNEGRIHEFDCSPDAQKCKTHDRKCATVSMVLEHCRDSGLLITYPECLSLLMGLRQRVGT